ncbi:hypothetical protein V8C37DRAFT_72717 [Trichoderma ceciliae]
MKLSPKDASFFGLDMELGAYMLRLEAAKAFVLIRRDVDRNKTTLKTLTARAFEKRRTKNTFKENVEQAAEDGSSSILHSLVGAMMPGDGFTNVFILACFTLSTSTLASIEKYHLKAVFIECLLQAGQDCIIFPELRDKFVGMIKSVCQEHDTTASEILLDAMEGIRRKRRRLDLSTGEETPAEYEIERLMFDADVFSSLETTEDADEPPDHNPKGSVFHLFGAMPERLDRLLEGSPLLKAIKASRQWRWERKRSSASGKARTDTIVALVANSTAQDTSLVLKVGYQTGRTIIRYLGLESSQEVPVSLMPTNPPPLP